MSRPKHSLVGLEPYDKPSCNIGLVSRLTAQSRKIRRGADNAPVSCEMTAMVPRRESTEIWRREDPWKHRGSGSLGRGANKEHDLNRTLAGFSEPTCHESDVVDFV